MVYRALFAATPAPCLVLTPELVIREVNEAYLHATNRSRAELLGQYLFDAFPDNPAHPEADGVRNLRASLERARDRVVADAMPMQRYDIPRPDGGFEERYWSPVNTPVPRSNGTTGLIIHHVDDVTETFRAQRELESRERRFRALVEDASDLILVVADHGEIMYHTPSVARLLGAGGRIGSALRWGDRAHPDDRAAALKLLDDARAAAGEGARADLRVLDERGAVRWMAARATDHRHDPAVGGVVVTLRDVTEQRSAEQTLQRQALQDPLTGLPNRRWFSDALTQALARAARAGQFVGLAVVDVDNFKRINDSLGHPAGDRLLAELAERMTAALRPGDTVARFAGDEFVILTEALHRPSDTMGVARRVVAAATGRYELARDLRTTVTLSVGASAAGVGVDADALLSHADAALYQAKRAGRNRLVWFEPAMRAHLRRRLETEQELLRALDEDQFVLYWQPIVGVHDGAALGAEALLRWRHPTRGLLAPAQFLPVAEESGLMAGICAWVLDCAMAQAARWKDLPTRPYVFVNTAAEQLSRPDLPDQLSDCAAAHGIEPSQVRLEVSECLLPSNVADTARLLASVRERGFGIALDDFGAGNTSLAWLRQLPVDALKLDRQFTMALDDPGTRAIVAALAQLAPALGVTSLAEGVESADQLATLAEVGCDFAQGFHFSRPVPAEEVTARLGAPPRAASPEVRTGRG